MPVMRRSVAEALDAGDPLADRRELFAFPEPGLIYMDGNSLGRPALAALAAVEQAAADEWAAGLVRSWERWVDEPTRIGDLLATELLGAERGEVVLCDQTSVNLFKLASAAAAARSDRSAIVTDASNFPSDRYVLEGVAADAGMELRVVAEPEIAGALDGEVALVSLSHVAYRSGALADMAEITSAAHGCGALTLWDLSHSVGVVPVDLGATGADLAVGCTYKYLGGGPGSPAFLYVRRDLQDQLAQPIRGWWSHRDMFAFSDDYDPASGIARFTTGTPPMLAMAAAGAAIRTVADAGIAAVRVKSERLTTLIVDLFDAWLAPLGFELGSPRDPARRGGHVSVRRRDGRALCDALIAEHDVVPDFRPPDTIRLGVAPLYTRFVDVWDALDRLRQAAEERS